MPAKASIFLDTSVIFAAVLSPEGGSRLLFRLGEMGFLDICVGQSVIQEADEVVRRKAPHTLPDLAILLSTVHVSVGSVPGSQDYEQAKELVNYIPDVRVLAEAICAAPDWFITLDRKHFLDNSSLAKLPFQIGTPGDFLEVFKENLK